MSDVKLFAYLSTAFGLEVDGAKPKEAHTQDNRLHAREPVSRTYPLGEADIRR